MTFASSSKQLKLSSKLFKSLDVRAIELQILYLTYGLKKSNLSDCNLTEFSEKILFRSTR